MENVLEVLEAPERLLTHLVEDCGITRPDLVDLGLTDYDARKRLDAASPRRMERAEAVLVPPAGLPDTVALVPVSDSLARRYLVHDVYIRDAALHGQIRLRATHLGWSDGGRIETVRPITRRWRVGSGAAIRQLPLPNSAAIAAEPDLLTAWPGPATLVELGKAISIGLPLGFAPNPTGGAPSLPGVRHVALASLLAAASRGGTLADVDKV
jgi:hypothetical protein